MNHSSLKKSLIIAMSCIPEVEGLEENNLILTTSAGIISGKVPSEQEIDDENLCTVFSIRFAIILKKNTLKIFLLQVLNL